MSNEQLLGALIELANKQPTEQEKTNWAEISLAALTAAKAKL